MSRLQKTYQEKLVSDLQSQLDIKNVHEVPRIEKVIVNVGAGRAIQDSRILETARNTLRKITGQQPIATKARKSVAGFKLREGNEIGVKVTLRGAQMYEFIDRLINIVLPRTRDFRGLSRGSFDPSGNYSLGLNDQSVFPELTYEDTNVTHGLQINIVTSGNTEQSEALLSALGFPFERSDNG